MAKIFLAPANNRSATEHLQNTMINGVDRQKLQRFTDRDFTEEKVSVWGNVPGTRGSWGKIEPGDYLLFYNKDEYTLLARAKGTERNPEMAKELWPDYDQTQEDGVWEYIIYTTEPQEVEISSKEIHDYAEHKKDHPQRFQKLNDEAHRKISEDYGSIDNFISRNLGTRRDPLEVPAPEPTDQEVEQEKSQLEVSMENDPDLREDQIYSDYQRKVRSRAFRKGVKEAYEYSCAFCGRSRRGPTGRPEVEAAHILPKSDDGNDDLRNGLALCRLHHWAFDRGWIKLNENYTLTVKEKENRKEYKEFEHLDGEKINLPQEEKFHPLSKFIQERNRK